MPVGEARLPFEICHMKRFRCPKCANELYFDSTQCVVCSSSVGFLPENFEALALTADGTGREIATWNGIAYGLCTNAQHHVCNWLVPADSVSGLCTSCQHNSIIPDLSVPENAKGWRAIELAKRHMFYSLIRWGLPRPTRAENETGGLAFEVLANTVKPDGTVDHVLTGHDSGLITLNIAEADDAKRESLRTAMHEPYRTLLGHFRHEIGHYYWDLLVRDGGRVDAFRQVFGDESADYGQALERHYQNGPPPDWPQNFISSYATVHPWEDFAESWAHYMHIVDSLETARAYGMSLGSPTGSKAEAEVDFKPYAAPNVDAIVDVWVPISLAINSINRSMGQRDFYPFVISHPVMRKLDFVHRLVHPNAPPLAAADDTERGGKWWWSILSGRRSTTKV